MGSCQVGSVSYLLQLFPELCDQVRSGQSPTSSSCFRSCVMGSGRAPLATQSVLDCCLLSSSSIRVWISERLSGAISTIDCTFFRLRPSVTRREHMAVNWGPVGPLERSVQHASLSAHTHYRFLSGDCWRLSRVQEHDKETRMPSL